MAILHHTIKASNFSTYQEHWHLDNFLRYTIYFGEKCYLTISSDSGDVADQIYEKLKHENNFKDIKLVGGSCYFLEIQQSLIKEIMDFVEKIDISTLKEGKSY